MRRTTPTQYGLWVALPLGVLAILVASGVIVAGAAKTLDLTVSAPVAAAVVGAALYALAMALVVAVDRLVFGARLTKNDLGVGHSLTWKELSLGIAGFIGFLFVSMLLITVAKTALPMLDWSQPQDVGFTTTLFGTDRILAFLLLVVVSPIAEELLFRGYLFHRLRKARMPLWLATIAVSLVFAVVHGQINVGVAVFVLSVFACGLRHYTNSIWPGTIIHGLNNLLQFYIVFVWGLGS